MIFDHIALQKTVTFLLEKSSFLPYHENPTQTSGNLRKSTI